MAVVAPWLRGTDVVGSASAGANVGLQARAADLRAAVQRQAAAEFAAKLNQQAYQFSAEQDAAAARLAIAQDQHAARLASELRQQDALDAYRQGELKVRQQNAETNASRLLRANFEPRVVDVDGNKLLQVEPNRYTLAPEPDKPKPITAANNPDAIIARERLRQALSGMPIVEKAGVAAAEDALRKALSPPATSTNLPPSLQMTNASTADPAFIRAQFKAGKLTRDEAINQLRALGFSN